jgi:hypothetical protein
VNLQSFANDLQIGICIVPRSPPVKVPVFKLLPLCLAVVCTGCASRRTSDYHLLPPTYFLRDGGVQRPMRLLVAHDTFVQPFVTRVGIDVPVLVDHVPASRREMEELFRRATPPRLLRARVTEDESLEQLVPPLLAAAPRGGDEASWWLVSLDPVTLARVDAGPVPAVDRDFLGEPLLPWGIHLITAGDLPRKATTLVILDKLPRGPWPRYGNENVEWERTVQGEARVISLPEPVSLEHLLSQRPFQ